MRLCLLLSALALSSPSFVLAQHVPSDAASEVDPLFADLPADFDTLKAELLEDVGGRVEGKSGDIPMLGWQDRKEYEVCDGMSDDAGSVDPGKVHTTHCVTMPNQKKTLTRKFLVHTPYNLQADKPPRLLFAFHGIGDQCFNFCSLMARVLDKKQAEMQAEGIERPVVVCPCGMAGNIAYMPFLSIRGWESGMCCGAGHKTDLAFVDEIIPRVSELLTKHVYGDQHTPEQMVKFASFHSWGFSNGGMFSHTLACERAHIFDSVASLGGTNAQYNCPYKKPTDATYKYRAGNDKPAVSVLDIHSLEDTIVAFDKRPAFATLRATRGAKSSMFQWASRNKCESAPKELSAKYIPDNCISTYSWSECNTTTQQKQLVQNVFRRKLTQTDARTQVELLRCHGNHMDGDLVQSLMYTFRFYNRTTYRIDPATIPQHSAAFVKCREKHTCRQLLNNRNLCQEKTGEE